MTPGEATLARRGDVPFDLVQFVAPISKSYVANRRSRLESRTMKTAHTRDLATVAEPQDYVASAASGERACSVPATA